MKTVTVRGVLLCIGLATVLLGTACGSGAGGVCDHLHDCDYVDDQDFNKCKEDINDAIEEGEIDRSEVRECKRCSRQNGCGIELFVDCLIECDDVWAQIDGSGF